MLTFVVLRLLWVFRNIEGSPVPRIVIPFDFVSRIVKDNDELSIFLGQNISLCCPNQLYRVYI